MQKKHFQVGRILRHEWRAGFFFGQAGDGTFDLQLNWTIYIIFCSLKKITQNLITIFEITKFS